MNNHVLVRRAGIPFSFVIASALFIACNSNESNQSEAPSSPQPADTRTYVGTVQGSGAFVAVVVDGSGALAYVCDGMPADPVGTPSTVQAWFNGTSDGRTVDLRQPAGRLRVQLAGTDMSGTLTLADGSDLIVTGRAVTGDAGLYRAEAEAGNKTVAGWILGADGQQRGGVASDGSGGTKLLGAPRLNLTQPTISLQGLATARIAKVGITPIPIP